MSSLFNPSSPRVGSPKPVSPLHSLSASSFTKAAQTDQTVLQANAAAAAGDVEALKKLHASGLKVNSADYDGRTPLHLAAAEGQMVAVEYLVSVGANLDAIDRWGLMPLQEALHNGHKDIAQLLSRPLAEKAKCSLWQCENDRAKLVLYHDLLRAGSHVSTTVYGDMAMNQERREDYTLFFKNLMQKGVQIVSIQDLVIADCALPEFEQFMMDLLQCETADPSITMQEIVEFKRGVLKGMTPDQMGHATTHVISFKLERGIDGQVMCKSYTISPIMDLLNSRLQIMTPVGVVLANRTSEPEKVRILEHVYKKMGLNIILNLPHPLNLSGGDYIPAGSDLCFIGTGLATDNAAVRYMMQKKVFGTRRVALVRDLFDRSPARRHLDAVFKIIDKDVVIILSSILGEENLKRRLVNEYVMCPKTKQYTLARMNVELEQYVKDQGYHVIKVPAELYHDVGLGIYNFGGGDLIVNDPALGNLISTDPNFKGKVQVVNFQWSSRMYEWLYKATLLFRQTDPACHHEMPPEIINAHKDAVTRSWDTITDGNIHQTTNQILMVAPVGFQTNAETAVDNYFMKKGNFTPEEIERKALLEFSGFVRDLTRAGVRVVLFANERWYGTPDAVFPNNWFSTHASTEFESKESTVVFYPMKTESRRKERREYIISELQAVYDRELSFVQWENSDFPHFLESTGVLIMDRKRRIAYVALSQRAYRRIAETWAQRMGYKLVTFHATDIQGHPIYHTNVMMAVGTTVAVVCSESVEDPTEKETLLSTLKESHEVVEITRAQMNEFCGNILEVHGEPYTKRLMCMSSRAYNAFTPEQREMLLKHVHELLHTDIPTIENIGGGGIRCMMGELF
eukprot:comp18669_c0_seq1/m.20327 comp18669_c0_seq1/g.20327  ORF comp18669_c0_seq1/g.20327 comp18669_c0_seq1/m.20327 type:complete len:854 (-) comp18669_c0_seq1:232-2793(-)